MSEQILWPPCWQYHPTADAPTSVMTDVSDVAVGAVLQQYINGQWCPLAFFSRALKPAETRSSTYDRELLANQTLSLLPRRKRIPHPNRPQTSYLCTFLSTVILLDKSDTSTSSVSTPQISAMSRAQPTQQLMPFLVPVQMLCTWIPPGLLRVGTGTD